MYTGLGRTAEELREDARILYANAQRAFDAGRYAEALGLFREAYRVVQNPIVLVAIGSALERLGRPDDASASYRDYLRLDPRGADVARVQGMLQTLAAGASAATRPVATRQAAVFAEAAQPVAPPIVPRSPYGSSDVDSLVIIGVAGAGIVAIGLAAWALSRRRSQPNRRRVRRLHRRAA